MNEGPIKPKINQLRKLGNSDEVYFERKRQIFQILETVVKEEKAKDPSFELNMESLKKIVSENKDRFPEGINSGLAVINYWKSAGGLNYLKEKLGLPFKKEKNEF